MDRGFDKTLLIPVETIVDSSTYELFKAQRKRTKRILLNQSATTKRGVQRKLTTIVRAKEDFIKLDLEEQVKKYVAELQSEITELINANPQPPKERHQVFMLKKRIVDTVLEAASISENHEIHLRFRTNFLDHVG